MTPNFEVPTTKILVCSLDKVLDTIAEHAPTRVISLLDDPNFAPEIPTLAPENHLKCAQEMTPNPQAGDAALGLPCIINFAATHDWQAPLLLHCQLGISRSPAAAFIIQCALTPQQPEIKIAHKMRALSTRIQPNFAMIVEADGLLGREGRMMDAIDTIENDLNTGEGHPPNEGEKAPSNAPNPLIIPFTPPEIVGVPIFT